jgi:digeranylgeranylglycerophospholipid reductase
LKTLLIEKRQEIGAPVRCAEAIGADLAKPFLPFDARWVDSTVSAFEIHNSCGNSLRLPPAEPTLVVNRKVFDYELALLAARAGAEVRTSTAAVGLVMDDRVVRGVKVESLGKEQSIQARLVVAADGTESQAARWAGLKTVPPLADYFLGIEFLLAGMGGKMDPEVCEYHLDHSLAPGGYLWVFPKGEDTANVGLVIGGDQGSEASALSYLERFVAAHYSETSIMAVIAGGIAVTGAVKPLVTDGLMVVGDAAHQADPLTAGGICLGMTGADMAMKVAVPAVHSGDVRAARLQEYEKMWQGRFGKMHQALYRIRKMLNRMNQDRLDGLVRMASELPVAEMSLGQLMLALLKNDPMLMFEVSSLIASGLILK